MVTLETMAGRAWYAYHCLPRTRGKPPSRRSLEAARNLYNGALRQVFEGRAPRADRLGDIAAALAVKPEWLMSGEGSAPTPTGPVPPLPGAEQDGASAVWVERDERYPSRQVVAVMARELGYSEAAVKGLLASQLKADIDPGEDHWWDVIDKLEARSKRQLDILRRERDDSDTFD